MGYGSGYVWDDGSPDNTDGPNRELLASEEKAKLKYEQQLVCKHMLKNYGTYSICKYCDLFVHDKK